MGVRRAAIVQLVAVGRRTVAEVVEVLRVAIVEVVLEVPQIVGLDQGTLVVQVAAVGEHALVVTVAQFVDMPDGHTRGGQVGVPARLLPVLEQVVLGGYAGLLETVEMVEAGAGRGGQRRRQGGGGAQFSDRRPARGPLEVGAGLHWVVGVPAIAHQTEVPRAADGVPRDRVVVEVGETAQHMAVLMAEGAYLQGAADVGDLVAVDLLATRRQLLRADIVQRPRVGPQPLAPDAAIAARIEHVAGHHVVAAVDGQRAEGWQDRAGVVRQGLHDGDGVLDQQVRLGPRVLRGVVVVALRMQ